MPIYEYRCGRCEHEFEEWQKISDDPIRVCPKCRARKVERLISVTSFQLKGSGWYATDYGRGSGGGGKKKRSSGDGSSGSGSSGSGSSGNGSSSSGSADSGSKPAGGTGSGGTGSSAAGAGQEQGRAAAA